MSVRRLVAVLALVAGSTAAQQLVLDANTQPESLGVGSDPSEFVALDGFVYFAATTPDAGRELWRSDGTPEGTELVVDLMPGVDDGRPVELTVFDDALFFVATTPDLGRELMRSDGTAAGTFVVRDLGIGETNSTPEELFVHDGLLYFSAIAGLSPFVGFGREPWVTDGTEAGTRFLADLSTGASDPADFTAHDGFVYFSADADGVGRELFRTDGTPLGTELVVDVNPGPGDSDPTDLVSYDGSLFFVANDTGTASPDVWRTDGTPGGSTLVLDPSSVNLPEQLVVFDGALFLAGRISGAGTEIVRSFGDAATTATFVDLQPGSGSSLPDELVVAGDTLYFTAQTTADGRELYAIDGATTTLIDLAPGAAGTWPTGLVAFGDAVLFTLGLGLDVEPWISDGTLGGTFQLANLLTGGSSSPHAVRVVAPGEAWFAADGDTIGAEVWRTDGTPRGTSLVVDVAGQPLTGDADPRELTTAVGRTYFAADDGVHGLEPWVTDGTSAGTHMLADLRSGPFGSDPHTFTPVGSRVAFVADGDTGRQLYGTDGAAVELIDPAPGGSESSPASLTVIDGLLYVTLFVDPIGAEPWTSDGTLAGTTLLADVFPGPQSGSLGDYTSFGDRVVFHGRNAATGHEPWVTDGTPAGTRPLVDVLPGPNGSGPQEITVFGDDALAFVGKTCSDPLEVCRQVYFFDGVAATVALSVPGSISGNGSQLLTPVNGRIVWLARPEPDTGPIRFHVYGSNGDSAESYELYTPGTTSDVIALVALGDAAIFAVSRSNTLDELWTTSGTPETTAMIWQGDDLSTPLVATDGAVFFVETVDGGERLWATDGTAEGTHLVAEPFAEPEQPTLVTVAEVRPLGSGDRVIFAGTDADGGREPWVAGTTPGSGARLADLTPGVPSSNPAGFARAGDAIVFAADDPVAGRELFAVPMAAAGGWALDVFGDVCSTSVGSTPRIVTTGTAQAGDQLTIGLEGADGSTLAGLYAALDVDTIPLGDCTLHLGPGLFLLELMPVAPDGTASVTLPIPSKASLQGQDFVFQYAVIDAGGPVAGAAALSDALEIVIGAD